MALSNQPATGLYHPEFEKDSCGFGLIAQIDDRPSHWLVDTAITSLMRLTHRGAMAADGKTGDGCGLLMKKPDEFLRHVALEAGIALNPLFASGMVFLNPDSRLADMARRRLEVELGNEALEVAGWRQVPTDLAACGSEALKTLPVLEQVFVNAPEGMDTGTFERKLFTARRRTEIAIDADDSFYIPSLSARVFSYKGLVTPENLPAFYTDLNDEKVATSICIFHQRFSTNTWPQWRLAQPFRFLAHNGEINTIRGNRLRARGRKHLSVPSCPAYPSCCRWYPCQDRTRAAWITC